MSNYYGDDFCDGWNPNWPYPPSPQNYSYNTEGPPYGPYHGHNESPLQPDLPLSGGVNPRPPPVFVRKSLVTIKGKFFTRGDRGNEPQPVSCTCNIRYKSQGGVWSTTIVGMSLQSDNVTWLGTWDSSVAAGTEHPWSPEGRCSWVVYSAGNNVIAADEGFFFIAANHANND